MAEEEDEEGIGDVDLFTLTDDGQSLTVNAKWLQHLQACLAGDALLRCPVGVDQGAWGVVFRNKKPLYHSLQ